MLMRSTTALLALLLLPTSVSAQGRIVVDTLHSKALEHNRIRGETNRAVYTYLPPSYDSATTRRYPVLYLLHGITSHPSEWLDGTYQGFNLAEAMDSLSRAGATEYIVVMPHADNSYGGSFYVQSVAFGGWERFVTRELVTFVDEHYRTLPERRSRGLAGQSMGGFGAIYIATRRPAIFGSLYALSPCCLGFVGELADTADTWKTVASPDSEVAAPLRGRVRIVRAMATAFARGPQLRVTGLREQPVVGPFPFRPDGSRNRETWRTWRGFLPLERLSHDLPAYRRLSAIGIDYGTADAIESVALGSLALADGLRRGGLNPLVQQHEGGHVDRTRERFEEGLLPFFGKVFTVDSEGAAGGRR
jgi:pimeloyl-ACP methyl ester carboxylesterase